MRPSRPGDDAGRPGLVDALDRLHRGWLVALLPATTLVVMSQCATEPPMTLFVVGAFAAGLYLYAVLALTPRPSHALWGLLMVIDGPVFALAGGRGTVRGLALRTWLVEGGAIGLGAVAMGLGVFRRDRGKESAAGVGVLLLALIGVLWLAAPLLPRLLAGGPRSWGAVAFGAVQGAVVRARQLRYGEEVERPFAPPLMALGLLGYAAAFIGGALLGQAGRPL